MEKRGNRSEEGITRIETCLENETVWLTRGRDSILLKLAQHNMGNSENRT